MIHHNTIRNLKDLVESNKEFEIELKEDNLKSEWDLTLFENRIDRIYSK